MLKIPVMKALIQRVSKASVSVNSRTVGEIGMGLLVFFCAVRGDTEKDLDYMVRKVLQLRIFGDDAGKMNLSVLDKKGGVLVVSQFTLAASTRKGNRPSFDAAEEPARAEAVYGEFVQRLRDAGLNVQTGAFAEHMEVSLVNDGPVTVMVDSRE